ncbi:hypothetical protein AKJ16_DCAP21368, partial [Drosera capensis]
FTLKSENILAKGYLPSCLSRTTLGAVRTTFAVYERNRGLIKLYRPRQNSAEIYPGGIIDQEVVARPAASSIALALPPLVVTAVRRTTAAAAPAAATAASAAAAVAAATTNACFLASTSGSIQAGTARVTVLDSIQLESLRRAPPTVADDRRKLHLLFSFAIVGGITVNGFMPLCSALFTDPHGNCIVFFVFGKIVRARKWNAEKGGVCLHRAVGSFLDAIVMLGGRSLFLSASSHVPLKVRAHRQPLLQVNQDSRGQMRHSWIHAAGLTYAEVEKATRHLPLHIPVSAAKVNWEQTLEILGFYCTIYRQLHLHHPLCLIAAKTKVSWLHFVDFNQLQHGLS